MDKTNALLHEARIQADENRSKEVRHFSASVVEAVEELQGQLSDAEESNKAVERALKDVDYRGTYEDGVLYLKQQLAAALAACEAKDALFDGFRDNILFRMGIDSPYRKELIAPFWERAKEALAIKPDASALKAHDEALIDRCAEVVIGIANNDAGNPYKQALRIGAEAVRELKGTL